MRNPPFIPGLPLLGHGPDMLRRPLALLTELAQHGDVVGFDLPGMPAVLVNHPELARHVLANSRVYDKNMRSYARLRALLGNGLATSDGEFWLRQRRIAQPVFTRQGIHDFGDVMVRFAVATREQWLARPGQPIDVLPLAVPTPANLRCRRALAELDDIVHRMIARRRTQPGEGADLLGRLMQARDPDTGEGMSDAQLRDEVVTMLLGGHDTTAMTLTWATVLLACHPSVHDRLHAELVATLADRDPNANDLERLPYLRMIVDETLRLYPPAWLVARNAARDDELGGYRIPHRTAVVVSPYTLHRSPALWQAPSAFWPERFAPERASERPAHAFIPFMSGPRQCIGNAFALMEARLVLAVLARRFRFRVAPGSVVEPEPVLTLGPRAGLAILVDPIGASQP